MSREILFRGQTRRKGARINMNGEPLPSIWVYGGVFLSKSNFSVIYKGVFRRESRVYTDTVDQFIGATDKNGVKIFENDILEFEATAKPLMVLSSMINILHSIAYAIRTAN